MEEITKEELLQLLRAQMQRSSQPQDRASLALKEEAARRAVSEGQSLDRLPDVRSSTASRGGEVILEPMTQSSADGALAERIGRLLGRIKSFPEARRVYEEEMAPLMALARSKGLDLNYSPLMNSMSRKASGGTAGSGGRSSGGGAVGLGPSPRPPIESSEDYAMAQKDPYEELRKKIIAERTRLVDRGPGYLQELLRRFRRG